MSARSRGGLIADFALLATNLIYVTPVGQWITSFVGGVINSNDQFAERILALVVSVVLVAQAVGAFLKRAPLQARLARQGVSSDMGCFGMLLLLFNYTLTLFALASILALTGFTPEVSPIPLFLAIALALVPTYLVGRALTPLSKPEKAHESPGVELLADALLMPYVIANTLVFNFITSFSAPRATTFEEHVFQGLSAVLVVFAVLLWYLPPRMLFLVEDYRSRGTWIRIIVAMLPVAWRWSVG